MFKTDVRVNSGGGDLLAHAWYGGCERPLVEHAER